MSWCENCGKSTHVACISYASSNKSELIECPACGQRCLVSLKHIKGEQDTELEAGANKKPSNTKVKPRKSVSRKHASQTNRDTEQFELATEQDQFQQQGVKPGAKQKRQPSSAVVPPPEVAVTTEQETLQNEDEESKPKGLVDALTRFFTPTSRKRACTVKKEMEEQTETDKQNTKSAPTDTGKGKKSIKNSELLSAASASNIKSVKMKPKKNLKSVATADQLNKNRKTQLIVKKYKKGKIGGEPQQSSLPRIPTVAELSRKKVKKSSKMLVDEKTKLKQTLIGDYLEKPEVPKRGRPQKRKLDEQQILTPKIEATELPAKETEKKKNRSKSPKKERANSNRESLDQLIENASRNDEEAPGSAKKRPRSKKSSDCRSSIIEHPKASLTPQTTMKDIVMSVKGRKKKVTDPGSTTKSKLIMVPKPSLDISTINDNETPKKLKKGKALLQRKNSSELLIEKLDKSKNRLSPTDAGKVAALVKERTAKVLASPPSGFGLDLPSAENELRKPASGSKGKIRIASNQKLELTSNSGDKLGKKKTGRKRLIDTPTPEKFVEKKPEKKMSLKEKRAAEILQQAKKGKKLSIIPQLVKDKKRIAKLVVAKQKLKKEKIRAVKKEKVLQPKAKNLFVKEDISDDGDNWSDQERRSKNDPDKKGKLVVIYSCT